MYVIIVETASTISRRSFHNVEVRIVKDTYSISASGFMPPSMGWSLKSKRAGLSGSTLGRRPGSIKICGPELKASKSS